MRHNETKNAMKPEEIRKEILLYEVESYWRQIFEEGEALQKELFNSLYEVFSILVIDEKHRIEAEEALCWTEYEYQKKQAEEKLLQKDKDAYEAMEKMWKEKDEQVEFETAILLLEDADIPVKMEDIDLEIEEYLKGAAAKSKNKTCRGIDYRRRQLKRIRKALVLKAIAADKSAAKRSKTEMRRRRKMIRTEPIEKQVGETNSHRAFRQYNWEYMSRSARAKRLCREIERLGFKPSDFSQKHLEEMWEQKIG